MLAEEEFYSSLEKCFTVTVAAAKILEIIITTNEDQCKSFIVANATEEKFYSSIRN